MIQPIATDIDQQLANHCTSTTAAWGPAAVRLLQGVVYHDDNLELWETLRANVSPLSEYFAKIGLLLVIDEADAMAYLRQPDDEEASDDPNNVPRLFRRTQLTYEQTLLCVLLRDHLRSFEEEDVQNEKCVVVQSDLLAIYENFFPVGSDNVKINKGLATNLRRLEELKFVRQFEKEPPSWEIRRIIKARLPLSELESLQQSLLEHIPASDEPAE